MENDSIRTIDAISVNPVTGNVELALIDDRPWDDYQDHMLWLMNKLNAYIGYIRSGQVNTEPAYAGRPAKFIVHFNGAPPREARLSLCRMRDHLAGLGIPLAATDSGNIKEEVELDTWANS